MDTPEPQIRPITSEEWCRYYGEHAPGQQPLTVAFSLDMSSRIAEVAHHRGISQTDVLVNALYLYFSTFPEPIRYAKGKKG